MSVVTRDNRGHNNGHLDRDGGRLIGAPGQSRRLTCSATIRDRKTACESADLVGGNRAGAQREKDGDCWLKDATQPLWASLSVRCEGKKSLAIISDGRRPVVGIRSEIRCEHSQLIDLQYDIARWS
jgi:hypothetical protein